MLIKLALILLISTFLCALVTPFFRKIAIKNGWVDIPNDRKIHTDAIPRLGGIAIFASFLAAVWLACNLFQTELAIPSQKIIGFLSSSTVVFILGIVDDIKKLNARPKFAVQILAAVMLALSGFLIDTSKLPFVGFFIGLGLTIIWLVYITNATNLIDGMDGLSSGVVIFASITLSIVSLLAGNLFAAIITLALLGSTLGFLLHNWHPAKIFMGDGGAMLLGFCLAAISIETSYKNTTGYAIFVPFLALSLPIIDTAYAILRRLYHHKPIFSGDRGHIHHKLLDVGFTVRQATLILYGVCILFSAAALATTFVKTPIAVAITIGVLLLSVLGIKILARAANNSSARE